MDQLFDLNEKIAVITGGSGILCGAMAVEMSKRGAKIGVLGRTKEKVNAKVSEIIRLPGFMVPPIDA